MNKFLGICVFIAVLNFCVKAENNDAVLTKSFKLTSFDNSSFTLSDSRISMEGTIGKHPFQVEQPGGKDFFTVWSQPLLKNSSKETISVTVSMAFYDKNNTFLRGISRDVASIKSGETLKMVNVASCYCVVPHNIWEKVDHYTITVLTGKPRKLTLYDTEPEPADE